MKVSIVTVCYNSESTIQRTIESVLLQTYKNIEYIIIDGYSMDETISIIEKYKSKIDVIVSEPDQGIYDAMNKGINLATGDIIAMLNSDDFYQDRNVIETVVDKFSSFPDVDLVFGDVAFVSPDNLERITRLYGSGHFKPWKLRFGWMPPHPATFIKKNIYDQFGLYSLDYKISSDYEMFVRLLLVNKLRFHHINKVLIKMRTGGVSTSGIKHSILLNREIVKACRNNNIYTNIIFVLSKIPFKVREYFCQPSEGAE